jgi:cytochrome c biogenesis protein CcdA
MSVGPVALAFVAGVLTSLSPCVLPILPLVLSAAASERKYGAVALAAGLAISFVLVGLFVATIGYSIGLTTELFRQVGAALMVMLGAVLIFPPLQTCLALASGPIANWTDRHLGSERGSGYAGQFGVGILLGAIWTPCVGPTLGAASLLAAPSAGRCHHAGVRHRRGAALTDRRAFVARSAAALAQADLVAKACHESRAWRASHSYRCSCLRWFRQAPGDRAR